MSADTVIESTEYKGYTLDIVVDPEGWASNPREWTNLGVLCLARGRNRDLPNEGHLPFDRLGTMKDVLDYARTECGALDPILVVSATDHSGVSYYTGLPRDRWDSGIVGIIFATPETVAECGTGLTEIAEVLEGEVATFSSWAGGEVFGWVVTNPSGRVIDSVWGYVGTDEFTYMLNEAQAVADVDIANQEKLLIFS